MDYSKLRGRLVTEYGTQVKALSVLLGISKASGSAKLRNEIAFTHKDILKLRKSLHLSDEEIIQYFFTENDEKN